MNSETIHSKVLDFLSIKDRTEYEVRQRIKKYLSREDTSRDEKHTIEQEIIDKLYELNLLDDLAYSHKLVSQKLAGKKGESKSTIYRFLLKKGVPNDHIVLALKEYPESAEFDKALKIAVSKLRFMADMPKVKQKQKLFRYLAGRRFTVSTITSVIDTIPELK